MLGARYMRNLALALAVTAIGLLGGCAFSSVDRPNVDKYQPLLSTAETFQVPENIALEKSQLALKALGYQLEPVVPELALVRTRPRNVITPAVCDCGEWNGRQVSGYASSSVELRLDRQGADAVRIGLRHSCVVNFTGRNLFHIPTHRETYECASRGRVENEVWDALRRVFRAQNQ